MLFKRLASAALATAVGIGAAGAAIAEDVTVSAEQLNALMQRLEQAEAKINELESQKAAGVSVDGSQIPQYGNAGTPSFLAPESLHRNASLSNAADDDLRQRLESLETKWVDLEKSVGDRVKDGTSNSDMQITGRIHADYWSFPDADAGIAAMEGGDPQDRFAFRRVRFGVKGNVKDNVTYKIEMEFANPNSTEFRDVYIGMKDLPFFQTLQVGNQKRPYSLDQLNSSNANVFIERPFISDGDQQDTRRLGIQSYGVSTDESWNWQYGLFNRENVQNDGSYLSDHYQLELAGRLANTFWYDDCTDGRSYAHWGIAASVADPDGKAGSSGNGANTARLRSRPEGRSSGRWLDTGAIAGANHEYLLGTEGVLNLGPMQFVGETSSVWVDRDGADTAYFWGAYGYASYFLTGEHIPWNRETGTLGKVKPYQNFWMVERCDGCTETGWGAWQVAARYSYADFSDSNIRGGVGEALTIGLNWWWNPNTRLQFNYINGRIHDRNVGGTLYAGDYQIVGTRFMVFF